jgi:predicted GTPase
MAKLLKSSKQMKKCRAKLKEKQVNHVEHALMCDISAKQDRNMQDRNMQTEELGSICMSS